MQFPLNILNRETRLDVGLKNNYVACKIKME
jgi:hypothetical protein